MTKSNIFGALLVACGLLNSFIKFYPDWTDYMKIRPKIHLALSVIFRSISVELIAKKIMYISQLRFSHLIDFDQNP